MICDHYGNVLTLGERECSIQRRHQKLIEESPSAALTPETREEMEAAAERACRAVGYRNAGTFEFLLGPDGSFYFIELNARLQVEHPVTELCTGIDIVREQLRVAAGEEVSVTGRAPRRGHAIEIRLNAEDPEHDFRPSPGLITRFTHPKGPGVRLDTFIESGSKIPPFYDSMVAKLVVWDSDRDAAIARAERALHETVIEGVPTTRDLAIEVLASEPFRSGRLLDLDARGAAGGDDVTISRRQARRQALFLLYQWDLSGQAIGSQYAGEIDTWARGIAHAVSERAAELDARITVGRRRVDRRPARGGGAERAPRRRARARARRGPGRGRDLGGGRVHEALRIRRRGKTGERHPWTNPTGGGGMTDADESLNKAEDLLARLEQARARLDETQDPDKAIEILQELADLAREVEAELQRAKRAAETEAAAPPAPEASDG